jgi:4-hydroxybenzoate polyprenyltransferase
LTQPDDPFEARLLVLDGHGSHATVEFIWECFQNNIQLLYLPPHASHVLQPLDVAVFSPLKTAYRKYLGYATYLNDSSVAGKRNFLECYRRARLDALSASNITSGWKATGLWPVSVKHPLLSPLLLKKPLPKRPITPKATQNNGQVNILPKLIGLEDSGVVWSTPRHSQDLRQQLDTYTATTKGSTTQRLLFSKVKRAFVEKDTQLAFVRRENEAWKAKFEAARPRKRKKVELSPQSKFANIEDIRRAQIAAGDVENSSSESSGSDIPSEAEDCIIVVADDSESDNNDDG